MFFHIAVLAMTSLTKPIVQSLAI